MKGRKIFSFFKPVIVFVSSILAFFPNFALDFLYSIFNPFSGKVISGIKYCILKARVNHVGNNVYIGPNVRIKGWKNLSLGDNVSIHDSCYLDASGGLVIGSDVSIAHQSSILTFEHTWSDRCLPIKSNNLLFKNVIIDNDVWIGAGVRVLSGVRIESRAIIAAGAVVTQNIPSNVIAAGVPAKPIKKI